MFDKLEKLPGAKTSKFKQRIYLPFTAEVPDVESPIRKEIENVLNGTKYKLDSYAKATVKDSNGRTISLQKILTRLKHPDLVNKVNDDEARKGAYQFESELMLVFTHAKLDLASMSTGRGWTSCMNLLTGINKRYVARDIQQGTFICYLTTKPDTNLNSPTARTLIKPYINTSDFQDIVYVTETSDKYGTQPPNFIEKVKEIISGIQNIPPGGYELLRGLYCDRLDKELTIHSPAIQAILDGRSEPENKEEVMVILRTLLPHVREKLFTIHDDLTVDVDADVSLSYANLKVIPVKFGKVNGGFWCHGNELTTLKNSPREIRYAFDCTNNKLKTLEGGPEIIGGSYYCYSNELRSLKGAPSRIDGDFSCWGNKLKSLEGAPRTVTKNFEATGCGLTSLKGSPEVVGGSFVVNRNELTSLKDGPKKVFNNYYADGNKIEGPHGFDGVTKEIMGKISIRGNDFDAYPGAWKDTVDKLKSETTASEVVAMYY